MSSKSMAHSFIGASSAAEAIRNLIARVANYEWDVNVELMDMEVFDADTSWCSEPSLVVESLLLQLSVLTIDYH